MKVSNVKGLANRDDPESCGGARKSGGEALTGESAGWVLSREIPNARDADPVGVRGRPQSALHFGEECWYPARSDTPGMHGSNLRENREILRSPQPARWGRIEKSKTYDDASSSSVAMRLRIESDVDKGSRRHSTFLASPTSVRRSEATGCSRCCGAR